jgi:HEXXH motif-containing protein
MQPQPATPARTTAPLALADVTLPLADTQTFRQVLNVYWRQLVKQATTIPNQLLSPATRTLYQRTLQLLAPQLRSDPRRVVHILRQPTHSALIETLAQHMGPQGDHALVDRLTREWCLLVLLEEAHLGLLPAEGITVSREGPWPTLRSISANITLTPGESVEAIVFSSGAFTLRDSSQKQAISLASSEEGETALGTLTRPYIPIVDGVFLALGDNNPLSHFEAHPDKSGNQLDLGGHPVDEWVRVLRESFALVDRYLPLIGEEMRLALRLIVPVGWHEQKHLSASYREAVGTVYMTLHPQLMTMVEALIHEFQHNKLNAALNLGPLLHNAFWPLYSSPVRPDPRPLHGVLLAVHAFQPVAKLYEKMAEADHPLSQNTYFFKRFRDIIRMDRAGAETVLKNGEPTPMGEGLLGEMRRLDQELAAYEAARWPEAAEGVAPDLPVDE